MRDSRTDKISDIKSRYKELRRKILSEEISQEDYEAELDELDNEALSMGLDLQELMKGGESYYISKETTKSTITLDDVNTLRSIGKKSINKFTKEDIEKAQKWAKRFYKELGVKSPFFRAWF